MAFLVAVFFLLVAAFSSPPPSSAATPAFNVTQLLARFPDYSTLNSLLSSTRVSDRTAGERSVADWINEKRTITILCPPNGVISAAVSSLGGTPPSSQTIANVLSYHVVLDYYDPAKLRTIANGSTLVTTLFQEAGPPANDGYLNITVVDGVGKCGRPIAGSPLTATINSAIFLQPFDISLLAIDSVLVPLDAAAAPPPPSSPPSAPSPSPSPSPASAAPASSSASAPAPASPSPSPAEPASPPIANPPSASPSPSSPPQPPSPPSFAAPVSGDRLFMVLIGLVAAMLFM